MWIKHLYTYVLFASICAVLYPEWPHCSALAWHSEGRTFAAHLECSKSCDLQPALHYAIRRAQGVRPCVECGCDQSIGSTVSDAIVRSLLWAIATRSSPLGYFS